MLATFGFVCVLIGSLWFVSLEEEEWLVYQEQLQGVFFFHLNCVQVISTHLTGFAVGSSDGLVSLGGIHTSLAVEWFL